MTDPNTDTEDTLSSGGIFAKHGVEPPLNQLFKQLRDLWQKEEPGRSFSQLATMLGVPRQNVSQWATGSDGRKPPWWVVMTLAETTGYRIVATSAEWTLEKADA